MSIDDEPSARRRRRCYGQACRRLGQIALGVLLMAILGGCTKSRFPDRKPVVPVRGAVFFNGKPSAGAVVSFQPVGEASSALRANGRVGDDGAFALTTYVTADGATSGEYVVTVYWADPSKRPAEDEEGEETDLAPDLLNGRFASRSSVLRATVNDKPIEFAPLDLAASEIPRSGEYRLREKRSGP
jgi:hypothetical protein